MKKRPHVNNLEDIILLKIFNIAKNVYKVIYMFNTITIKIPVIFSTQIEKNPKIYMEPHTHTCTHTTTTIN